MANAEIIPISTNTQTFTNTDCAKTNSCDLQDFVVKQLDYEAKFNGGKIDVFGTQMYAVYNTTSLDNLENYGIVQFMKGCQFSSQLVNGKVVNSRDRTIEHYGAVVPYYFPKEVIDGFVKDPIDWGAEENMPSRHFFYLNKYVSDQEPQKDDYYGMLKPAIPRLYLRDMPGIAELNEDGSATNISLQYRLCIYKTADVPKVVADSNLDFAIPLQCFSWNSSFVYNFGTKKFEQPPGLVEFCL